MFVTHDQQALRRLFHIDDHLLKGLVLFTMLGSFVGCGRAPHQRVAVAGQVLLDGQPVSNGSIQFQPLNGEGPLVAATIRQGRFELPQQQGPVQGPAKIRIHIQNDLGFALDDDVSYAAVAQGTRHPPSPYFAGPVSLKEPAEPEILLESNSSELRFELVTDSSLGRR